MSFDYSYKVIKSGRKTVALQIKGGEVIVRAPYAMRDDDISRFVVEHSDWIKKHISLIDQRKEALKKEERLSADEIAELVKRAKEIIPKRVAHYAELLGVTYGSITIRMQKTRWGSCSSKGNLNFNCLLMLTPDDVIDSVVVHELCHRKYMNHSEQFYREILRVFPEYKRCRAWLRENGDSLMARGGKQ